ncbi:hypothetical protein, partial [uncultured Duncaniella sp.]
MSDNIIPAKANHQPVSNNETGNIRNFQFPQLTSPIIRNTQRRTLLSDISDARDVDGISFPTHLREMQFRPAGFIALSLDAGLPPHRCCYITTRLLFLFKLVMESSLGL